MLRLLSEIGDVLGDRKEVTGDDLDKLKYTEQVLSHAHTKVIFYEIGLPCNHSYIFSLKKCTKLLHICISQ